MSSNEVAAALDSLDAAFDELAALPLDALTDSERLAVQDRLETHRRRQPAVEHRLITGLAQCPPAELGAKNLADVLSTRLRISTTEARRRIAEAEDLGARTALSGQPLPPQMPNTAAAQARGQIGAEHVRIIRKFFGQLPDSVDYQTREAAEATLARVACEHTPDGLRQAADRLAALLDPDGTLGDAERARRRHLTVGKQQADGMVKSAGCWIPRPAPAWTRCWPNWPPRAWPTPTTTPRVWTGHPARPRCRPTCAPSRNATTTR